MIAIKDCYACSQSKVVRRVLLRCDMQAITDMVIANESRVAKSRVVTTFNKARQVLINVAIRYSIDRP